MFKSKKFIAGFLSFVSMLFLLLPLLFPSSFTQNHSVVVDGNPDDWVGKAPQAENSEAYDGGEYIWRDAVNDDSGDGDYVYPSNPVFDTYPEDDQVYDLIEWRVTWDSNYVYFLFRVANITNSWNSSRGFSHQLPIVLIDKDRVPGSGRTDVIRGANCRVSSEAAWEWAVWASGWGIGAEDAYGNVYEDSSFVGAQVAGASTTNCIEMAVPISYIGDPTGQTWRFYVILGPEEFSHCRRVDEFPSEWAIGGGEGDAEHWGDDPNFLDLAFYSSTEEQEAELGEYKYTGETVILNGYKDVTFNGEAFGGSLEIEGLETVMNGTEDRTVLFNVTCRLDVAETHIYNVTVWVAGISPNTTCEEDYSFSFSENSFLLAPGQSRTVTLLVEYLGNCSHSFLSSGSYSVMVSANFTCDVENVQRTAVNGFEVLSSVPPIGGQARRIDVILLFHFNQNLVPYGDQANDACYVGLLKTLRKHSQSKFAIHISGCLLEDLQWFNNTAIQLVRDGVEEGQFEVIGSTYIQNIMYSTRMNDTDYQFNEMQIKKHRELIQKIFGVAPKGFWNPERTWSQSFVPLLVRNGYEYTQVEDYILERSGASGSEYLVRTTSLNGSQLVIFNDDKNFEGIVNGAIDSGDASYMVDFLWEQYNLDVNDQFAVCYFEDAEATGLWDYENGENPHIDWNNLDQILTVLESHPWIKLTTYEEFLKNHAPAEDVSPVLDGAATWMGGDSWFDQNNSPLMNGYRAFFNQIRNYLNRVNQTIQEAKQQGKDTEAAEKMLSHAWTTLLAHQYEFGCFSQPNRTELELARTARVAAEAALYSLNPSSETEIDEIDVNDDGTVEVVVRNQFNFLVFSRRGGRLLYWFDIVNGEELVGNENFLYYLEPYTDDNRYVPALRKGNPLWPWLSGNNLIPWDKYKQFIIRRRALNDYLKVEGEYIGGSNLTLVNAEYTLEGLENNSVIFSYSSGEITLKKQVSIPPSNSEVQVHYSIVYRGSSPTDLELEIESEFCPSYMTVMEAGRDILQYWSNNQIVSEEQLNSLSNVGVLNVQTGELVKFAPVNSTISLRGDQHKDVFGKILAAKFELLGVANTTVNFCFSISWEKITPQQFFFREIRTENGKLVVEVPTYVRKVVACYQQDGETINKTLKYYGAQTVYTELPQSPYRIIIQDLYGNTYTFVPAQGTVSFSNLKGKIPVNKISLQCNLQVKFGTSLLVIFYDWNETLEGNVTLWSGASPTNVSLSLNVSHPQGKLIKKALLVIADEQGTPITTLGSFVTCRRTLMERIVELDKLWPYATPEERTLIEAEYTMIKEAWQTAPAE
ncbi:hypothetical protein DRO45_00290 [Candidatus Bathyarchaeota archaeon]|nr:MAG: hypothetical protein DRO45_00290 [Candidatus Bathyarchaeota archaeon]